MSNFLPPSDQLSSVARLIKLTEVSGADVKRAIEEWKDNPPSGEFKNILEAEIESEI